MALFFPDPEMERFKFAEGKQYEPSAFAKATAGQERKGAQ
jgi:hypothetical protein